MNNVGNIKKIIKIIDTEINTYNTNIDSFEIELKIMEKYPDYYHQFPFLIKKMCKRDNLSMLYKMIDKLEDVELGIDTIENVEFNLGNELADKYINPIIKK